MIGRVERDDRTAEVLYAFGSAGYFNFLHITCKEGVTFVLEILLDGVPDLEGGVGLDAAIEHISLFRGKVVCADDRKSVGRNCACFRLGLQLVQTIRAAVETVVLGLHIISELLALIRR